MRSVIIGLATLAISTVEARVGFGKCPPTNITMDDIDKEAYAGRWYQVLRDDDKFPGKNTRCVTQEITLREDGMLNFYAHAFTKKDGQTHGVDRILWKCGENPGNSTCEFKVDPEKRAKFKEAMKERKEAKKEARKEARKEAKKERMEAMKEGNETREERKQARKEWKEAREERIESRKGMLSNLFEYFQGKKDRFGEEKTYNLIATDYENYHIVHSCHQFAHNSMHVEYLMIGSRTPEMPKGEKLEEIKRIIKEKVPKYDLDTYKGFDDDIQKPWCPEKYEWKSDNDILQN